MRVMAVDLGDARTGIALSDLTGTIAGKAWVITEWNMETLANSVADTARANDVGVIVLGWPKNMDSSIGERALKCEKFAKTIEEKTGLEVVLWDERRTTVDAHRILAENGRSVKRRKKTVDAVAATLILEGYLSYINR